MLEDSGGTRQSPGPLSSGQGSEGAAGTPEGRSLAGWSWGGGGERVEGSFLGMCEAVRHQVAFRDQRKEEAGLRGPRGAGRAWAGPPAALVAPKKSSWGGGAAEQEESLFPGNDVVPRVCGNHVQVSRGEDRG